MVLGNDTQYDLSWEEQDKIRRRLDIKARLKREGIMKRYNPFFHMKGILMNDPAIDRYMDFRKKGRMPNVPLAPRIFYTYISLVFLPIGLLAYGIKKEREPYLIDCANGALPYCDRPNRTIATGDFK